MGRAHNNAKMGDPLHLSYLTTVKIRGCILLFLLCCTAAASYGQKGVWDAGQDKVRDKSSGLKGTLAAYKKHLEEWGMDTSYRHAFSIGGRLRTDGWSGGLLYEYRDNNGKRHLCSLMLCEVKHEKQVKQKADASAFPQLGAPSAFVFGKIANLYLLQLGYSREKLLLPGILEGNISIGFRWGGGFSLGLLKPYYLRVIHVDYTPDQVVSLKDEKYSAANDSLFLNRRDILGASGWSKGLDEIRYVPGAFAEGAFTILPGRRKAGLIQVITLGGQLSVHTKSLPIMAQQKAQAWQAALFVGLEFGKRW